MSEVSGVIILALVYKPLALLPSNSHCFQCKSSAECSPGIFIDNQGQGHCEGQGLLVSQGQKGLWSLYGQRHIVHWLCCQVSAGFQWFK